jgi:monofunctional glycosyltransferase
MREMRKALKSAGERLLAYARFPHEPPSFLRQKTEAFKERARQWRAQRSAAARRDSIEAESDAPFWEPLAPRSGAPGIADDAAVPQARPFLERPADLPRAQPDTEGTAEPIWRERLPGWRERLPAWPGLLRMAGIALLVFLTLPYALIPVYRVIDPPFSALMARQWLTGTSIRHQWVDFEDISPALPQAVVISEDSAFCRHWGVDWNAVGEAIDDAEDGNGVRGASTIPMQAAKNLFLWNGTSYIRKALEVPLAYWMSAIWPKRRVLEIYLNIAEWGPGVFGAEAAARHHFRKSAADLTPREAALLAAALPSPLKRNAGRPNGLTARIAARIGARVAREAQDASCVFPRGR